MKRMRTKMIEIHAEFPPEELMKMVASGKRAIPRALQLMATEVWGNIGREAPTNEGRLAGSFELFKIDELTWRIATAVEYASYVHEGTPPHEIVPLHAQALFWEGAEHPVKRVNHPGTQPNPFIDRAIESAGLRSEEFARMAIEEMT